MEEKAEKNLTNRNKKKFYYGWYVVAVCFLMIFITLGFGSSTKSTYLKVICEELGYARSAFSVNDSLRYVVTAVASFIFGSVILKLKPKRMIFFGFLFLIISFSIYCIATKLWHFYIGGIFLGAGFSWTGTTLVGYIVDKWFPSNKGTIMGIILSANGIGGVASENLMTPIILNDKEMLSGNGFLSKFTEFFSNITGLTGWRLSYFITILLFTLTALIVILIIRNSPQDKGFEPLILKNKKSNKKKLEWEGQELKVILRKPYFYITAVCVFIFGFILQSSSGISKAHMLDKGFSSETIILLFSFSALLLMFSKILTGILFDKFGIKLVVILCGACAFASILCLSLINSVALVPAWIYIILFPLSLPLETIVIPLLVSQMFGKKAYASILGYFIAFNMIGYATGVPIVNLFYDLQGTYSGVLTVQAIIVFITTILSVLSIIWADRDRKIFLQNNESL